MADDPKNSDSRDPRTVAERWAAARGVLVKALRSTHTLRSTGGSIASSSGPSAALDFGLRPPRPFPKVVQLNFVAGPQNGHNLYLGYGPRFLGSDPSDIWTIDPEVRGRILEFSLNAQGVPQVRALQAGAVWLNREPLTREHEIRDGDRIDFADSRIEIKLREAAQLSP